MIVPSVAPAVIGSHVSVAAANGRFRSATGRPAIDRTSRAATAHTRHAAAIGRTSRVAAIGPPRASSTGRRTRAPCRFVWIRAVSMP